MKGLTSFVVWLAVVGVVGAGENDIVKRLEQGGARARDYFDDNDRLVLLLVFNEGSVIDLAELCELRRLGTLMIANRAVNDEEMQAISTLAGLRSLAFDGSTVTDTHLKQLGKLRRLRELSLTGTGVTDAGLGDLAVLANLECLWLDGTAVTDAGLRHLERLDRLQHLDLNNCPGVTEAGVARLNKVLPRCVIRR